MNKFDTYVWIKEVINSCENFKQWEKSLKLIQRFEMIYPNTGDSHLRTSLRVHHDQKLKTFNKDEIQDSEEVRSEHKKA